MPFNNRARSSFIDDLKKNVKKIGCKRKINFDEPVSNKITALDSIDCNKPVAVGIQNDATDEKKHFPARVQVEYTQCLDSEFNVKTEVKNNYKNDAKKAVSSGVKIIEDVIIKPAYIDTIDIKNDNVNYGPTVILPEAEDVNMTPTNEIDPVLLLQDMQNVEHFITPDDTSALNEDILCQPKTSYDDVSLIIIQADVHNHNKAKDTSTVPETIKDNNNVTTTQICYEINETIENYYVQETQKIELQLSPQDEKKVGSEERKINETIDNDYVQETQKIELKLLPQDKRRVESEEGKINETIENYYVEEELTEDKKKVGDEEGSKNDNTVTKKRGKSVRKSKNNVDASAYLDFLSEDEKNDFQWDSTSWDGTDESESDDESSNENRQKLTKTKKTKKNNNKKKTKKDNSNNKEDGLVGDRGNKKEKKVSVRKERRTLRLSGKPYKTCTGREIPAKKVQPNPCINAKKCANKCNEIPEERRQALFKHFNNLDLQRKRDWIAAMSVREKPKRKRKIDAVRKEYSYSYFINEGEGRRKVCLRFLISTLDISQKFIHYTLSNMTLGSAQEDLRGSTVPPNKTKEDTLNSVRNFIKSLPAVPSHYCRKDSTRLYLPSEMKSVSNVYNVYKKKQREAGVDFVGEKVFRNVFLKEFNLAFHIPKKDKCLKCVRFQNQKDEKSLQEKSEHESDRDMTLARFKAHQGLRNIDDSTLCVSFDLQKVLNTPMGNSMLFFYSRKYAVYNLTFYESITREGYCYTWGESEGKRGGNEIATIIERYIAEVDERKIAEKVLFYCDSCPGQNKNKIVLSSLHFNLQKCENIKTIQINYLLPGHTNMPVDSMHAVIENSVHNTTIWAPSQWATVFQIARKSPKPYKVEVLQHSDFRGYDLISDKYFRGNLVGKIGKIRTATFKKTIPNKMYVKYTMDSSAPVHEIEVLGAKNRLPAQIYMSALPISNQKHTDLLNLCIKGAIPKIYHNEYNALAPANVKDTLVESDVEDVDNN